MQCPARPSGCCVLSHPNIDTRKISCLPQARPVATRPGLAPAWEPARKVGPGLICLHSVISSQPTEAGQRDEGAAAHVHPGPLQASWWQPTTKPERAGDFLETSWNCSELGEKQLDSCGIHCVHGGGSKRPLIVYTLNSFATNRMLSRERKKCLRGHGIDTRLDRALPQNPFCLLAMTRDGRMG